MAASNGHIDVAEYLVTKCKVPVECVSDVCATCHMLYPTVYQLTVYLQDGEKPIHLATARGLNEMVRALIQMGCSPTTCTEVEVLKVSAIFFPLQFNWCISCIQQPNWQPIHIACVNGQKILLCELIEKYGVDPHAEDQVRCMLLHVMIMT